MNIEKFVDNVIDQYISKFYGRNDLPIDLKKRLRNLIIDDYKGYEIDKLTVNDIVEILQLSDIYTEIEDYFLGRDSELDI